MKKYEFTATTAKSDIIIGLIFPVVIMIPILAIQLAVFYLKLNNFIKAYPIFLFLLVLVFFWRRVSSNKKNTREIGKRLYRRTLW